MQASITRRSVRWQLCMCWHRLLRQTALRGLTSWILDPWILPTPFTSSTSPSGDLRMQHTEEHGEFKRRARIGKGVQAKAARPCTGRH